LDSTGSGQGPVAGCCECGDEPSGSCATKLVSYNKSVLVYHYRTAPEIAWCKISRNCHLGKRANSDERLQNFKYFIIPKDEHESEQDHHHSVLWHTLLNVTDNQVQRRLYLLVLQHCGKSRKVCLQHFSCPTYRIRRHIKHLLQNSNSRHFSTN
jgi:hypothetical protein